MRSFAPATAMDRRQAGSGRQAGSADAHRLGLVSSSANRARWVAKEAAETDEKQRARREAIAEGKITRRSSTRTSRRRPRAFTSTGSSLRRHAARSLEPAGRAVRREVRRRVARFRTLRDDVGRSAADGPHPAAARSGKRSRMRRGCAGGGARRSRSRRRMSRRSDRPRRGGAAGAPRSEARRGLSPSRGSRRCGGAGGGGGAISCASKSRTVRRPT